MLALDDAEIPARSNFMERRAIAVANANWFRAMAWRALRDGSPKGELRAANARAAARIVIRMAKRDALVNRMGNDPFSERSLGLPHSCLREE